MLLDQVCDGRFHPSFVRDHFAGSSATRKEMKKKYNLLGTEF